MDSEVRMAAHEHQAQHIVPVLGAVDRFRGIGLAVALQRFRLQRQRRLYR